MSEEQIKDLFIDVISQKEASKIPGLTKHKLYHYRHSDPPSLGTMLEVLFRANKISITADEFKAEKE